MGAIFLPCKRFVPARNYHPAESFRRYDFPGNLNITHLKKKLAIENKCDTRAKWNYFPIPRTVITRM